MKRFLIVQLGSYGDCLIATTIARQIKEDDPGCILDWLIGDKYKDILRGNPYVDHPIILYSVKSRLDVKKQWFHVLDTVHQVQTEYDGIYFTQAYPGNPQNFRGSLRASMFRAYPNPITIPLAPVLQLVEPEPEHVMLFTEINRVMNYPHRILIECSPESNQSFVTPERMMVVAKEIASRFPDACLILSGTKPFESDMPNILDASSLTFRENAELTKYCTLFIGTGSGITQIVQSDWAKPLPMIQFLKQGTVASVISNNEYFHLPTDQIIEIAECSNKHIVDCVTMVLLNGFEMARKTYCERIIPDFNIIRFHMKFDTAMITGKPWDIIPAFFDTCRDYGLSEGLIEFIGTIPESMMMLVNRRLEGVK